MKKNIKKSITEYFMITLGSLLMSIGVYFFKIPNGFSTGGVSGISTIFGKILPFLTTAKWLMIINIFLLVVGFIFLGKENGIKTVYCSLLFSGLTMFFEKYIPLQSPLTDQPFLELVYAIFITALGSAIIFENNSSSGGTDIVALLLKKYTSVNEGRALLYADFVVAFSSIFVFGIKIGLFSLLGLFMKAFLVDSIIENIRTCKYFIVITSKPDEVLKYVLVDLHHGVTINEAIGGFSGEKKTMIHTVCKRIEAIKLRRKIYEIDPHAFTIITSTSEIVGRGFRGVL